MCAPILDIALLRDQLHFECIEFWIRQATEEIDATGDLGCNLKKEVPYLLRRARETKRIRRVPMGNNELTWPDRSHLFGLVADGNYEIKVLVLKLTPGLAPGVTRVNSVVFPENQERHRVYLPGWMRTGAVDLKTVTCLPAKNVLSENASRGITVAKNEDFVRRVGVHFEFHRAKALGREQFFQILKKKSRVGRNFSSEFGIEIRAAKPLDEVPICGFLEKNPAQASDFGLTFSSFGRRTLSTPSSTLRLEVRMLFMRRRVNCAVSIEV